MKNENEYNDEGKISPKDIGLEREQLFSLLVSSITSDVYQKIEEKESRSRNIFIGVSSLVLAIVVSIGGFLLNQVLDVTIEKKLAVAQKETLGKSIFVVEVAALDIEARALRESKSFSREDAKSIIKKIDRLYKEGVLSQSDPKIINENKEKLTYSVSSSILAFAQAGRVDLILEVERKASIVAQESDEVPVVMAISLGDRLLQDPKAPKSWESDEILSVEYRKFMDYLKKAKNKGYPELYILYELLMSQSRGLPESDFEPFLNDLNHLSLEDTNNFKERMLSIIKSENNSGEVREKELALKIIKQYSNKNTVLDDLLDDIALSP